MKPSRVRIAAVAVGGFGGNRRLGGFGGNRGGGARWRSQTAALIISTLSGAGKHLSPQPPQLPMAQLNAKKILKSREKRKL